MKTDLPRRAVWLTFTARVERAPHHRARSASTKSVRWLLYLTRLLPHIKLIHRDRCSSMHQTFQRIDRPIKTGIKDLELVLCERLQQIINRILMRRGSADADFQPYKLRSPERLDHGFDSVMAAVTACLLDSETPRFQIEIVVNKKEIVDSQVEFAQEALQRRTRDIHPVEGAGEFDQLGAKPPRPTLGCSPWGETDRPSSCGSLDYPHADVVAGLGVGGTGVAQSNNEAQRYFFFSGSFFSAAFGAAAAGAASFFSPGLASPAAGAAAPGAPAGAAPSAAASTTAFPLRATSGSLAPSGPTA